MNDGIPVYIILKNFMQRKTNEIPN